MLNQTFRTSSSTKKINFQKNFQSHLWNHCKKRNHFVKYCWFKTKKENTQGNLNKNAFDDNSGVLYNKHYLDSNTTNHMGNRRNYFDNFNLFSKPIQVKIGDGSCINAVGDGNVPSEVFTGKSWIPAPVHNILFVLDDLKYNLFSIGCILEKGQTVMLGIRRDKLHDMNFVKGIQMQQIAYISMERNQRNLQRWGQ